MSDGMVNAGFGMPEHTRRKLKVPINELFQEFAKKHPEVRRMLSQARQIGDLRGAMVPFAMKRQVWSGPGFMLCGDAASLVDPVSGDGIMQAVRSGMLAGMAVKSGEQGVYDRQVEKYLWQRMRSPRRTIKFIRLFPGVIRMAAWMGRFEWLRNRFQKWIW